MRLAVAATPDVAIPTLEFLLSSSHSLEIIFTTEDKPVGRGRTLTPSDVANWADSQAVPCIKIGKAEQMAAHLEDIDCVVTVAFGILLPPQILSIPQHGFINLHFSHLPSWRGAAPVQRAIEAGDENLGISVFALDEGMDTGPIYVQSSYPPTHSINRHKGHRNKIALPAPQADCPPPHPHPNRDNNPAQGKPIQSNTKPTTPASSINNQIEEYPLPPSPPLYPITKQELPLASEPTPEDLNNRFRCKI